MNPAPDTAGCVTSHHYLCLDTPSNALDTTFSVSLQQPILVFIFMQIIFMQMLNINLGNLDRSVHRMS